MFQDIRYAIRSYLRAPGFTLVAIVTLALGIGGATAIFSIVDGIVLRPLPYPEPEQIVRLSHLTRGQEDAAFAAGDYLDIKRDSTTFESMAGYREDLVDLTGSGDPVRVTGVQTTTGFFDVFKAAPLLGRTYQDAVDRPGDTVAVIGEGLWQRQFGSGVASVASASAPAMIWTAAEKSLSPVFTSAAQSGFAASPSPDVISLASPMP